MASCIACTTLAGTEKASNVFCVCSTNHTAMFKNFFLTAWRNLSKNKLFTVLHVFGLALGMSLCLLYIAWLVFIFSYDDFHPDRDRIYRVNSLLQNHEEN